MQHEKYLLVALRCSKWSARKFDPKATQEVVDTHNAASDVGRFNKMLLSKVYINPVHSAFAAARAQHDKLTLPEKPLLLFEFHGSEHGVKEQAELVQQIADEHGAIGFEWATRPEDRSRLWQARHNAYFALLQLRPGSQIGRAHV